MGNIGCLVLGAKRRFMAMRKSGRVVNGLVEVVFEETVNPAQ